MAAAHHTHAALAALTATFLCHTPLLHVPAAQAQDTACITPLHTDPATVPAPPELLELRRFATGRGVRVAIIDTGVAPHPQLPHLRPGGDFVDPTNPNPFLDCDSHGTVVAGIIASSERGIAPDAELVTIRQTSAHYRSNTDDHTGSLDTLAQAIHNALDEHARVINISIVSCLPPYLAEQLNLHPLQTAVARAEREGAVIVAAAGNANSNCVSGFRVYPAHLATVLAVGARDGTHTIADYSVAGHPDAPALSAPGTVPLALASDAQGWASGTPGQQHADGSYQAQAYVGTSFAAPLVTGSLALLIERFPHLRPAELRALVHAAAEPNGGALTPQAIITQLPPDHLQVRSPLLIDAPSTPPSPTPTRWWFVVACLLGLSALVITINALVRRP